MKAYLDTTILAHILLDQFGMGPRASASLARFVESELPVYAIKEFKAGPLLYYCWAHNALKQSRSFSQFAERLQNLQANPYQKRRASTALQAIKNASSFISSHKTMGSLSDKYGTFADPMEGMADEIRLEIRGMMEQAWSNRRKVATRVIQELACYREEDPTEDLNGHVRLGETVCAPECNCALDSGIRSNPAILRLLHKAAKKLVANTEHHRQTKILKELISHLNNPVSREQCRGLGDVIFAIFCPQESVILTSNINDHGPLAAAIGKRAEGI